ncbi:hypothetical protein PCLA_04f0040 [Pseudomonas citronellolis]|nr:hypothetical protein PCLA_04f0040 [Pseudomonas citronellolis]
MTPWRPAVSDWHWCRSSFGWNNRRYTLGVPPFSRLGARSLPSLAMKLPCCRCPLPSSGPRRCA